MQDFKNLKIWQESHQLALAIYQASKNYPKDELYGLVSQIRRAAVSIPANIAESSMRSSDPDFARFLNISLGSLSELEYLLLLSTELGYLDSAHHRNLNAKINATRKMLLGLRTKLKASS